MANNPKHLQTVIAYFETRRRITAIERKALQKLTKELPNPLLEECSFCAKFETEVDLLIHGDKKARICSTCVHEMVSLLSAPNNDSAIGD